MPLCVVEVGLPDDDVDELVLEGVGVVDVGLVVGVVDVAVLVGAVGVPPEVGWVLVMTVGIVELDSQIIVEVVLSFVPGAPPV